MIAAKCLARETSYIVRLMVTRWSFRTLILNAEAISYVLQRIDEKQCRHAFTRTTLLKTVCNHCKHCRTVDVLLTKESLWMAVINWTTRRPQRKRPIGECNRHSCTRSCFQRQVMDIGICINSKRHFDEVCKQCFWLLGGCYSIVGMATLLISSLKILLITMSFTLWKNSTIETFRTNVLLNYSVEMFCSGKYTISISSTQSFQRSVI